jgi:hypothetical protein
MAPQFTNGLFSGSDRTGLEAALTCAASSRRQEAATGRLPDEGGPVSPKDVAPKCGRAIDVDARRMRCSPA